MTRRSLSAFTLLLASVLAACSSSHAIEYTPSPSRLSMPSIDVDAEVVVNIADVTAQDPDGEDVTDTDTNTVPVTGLPLIDLVKANGGVVDTNGSGRDDAGDQIVYQHSEVSL